MNEKITKIFLSLLAFAAITFAFSSIEAFGQKKSTAKAKMDTPTLSAVSVGQTFVDIQVTAGTTTGAPAGFSLQWMKYDDFVANGGQWASSDSLNLCKASFSGNANASRYDLLPGESVTIRVGDILMDNGASTNCPQILECDTTYIFRAFAHANSTLMRSDFSADLIVTTSPCKTEGGCTLTQGYWKNHGPIPTGNNSNEWDLTEMMLGNNTYTDFQVLDIFNTEVKGNGLISLAHQLAAAKLNVANGAETTPEVLQAIADADAIIGSLWIPPVGSGYLAPKNVSTLVGKLDDYNNGRLTEAGHCD